MLAAMMVDRPYADWPTPGVIDAQVCLMRKRLGPASPVKITTHWGIGYSATIEETPKGDA
jgi:DNA-binding response OmpR family regulator